MLLEKIREAAGNTQVVAPANDEEAHLAAAVAEGWIGSLTPSLLAAAPRLRWLQAPTIGVERELFPELVESKVVVTNFRHLSDAEVSTHALALLLALCQDLKKLLRHQSARLWKREASIRNLDRMTVLILGLGGIGWAVVRRLAPFGPRIIAVDPKVTGADLSISELARPERLPELLPEADAVVVCAPLTPHTKGLFDEKMFRLMRPDALFINVGRGEIVQTAALERALREHWIFAAAIDVVDPEPLASDSPLWALDNLIVTPHMASFAAPAERRRLDILLENVRCFVEGRPFKTAVDKRLWY